MRDEDALGHIMRMALVAAGLFAARLVAAELFAALAITPIAEAGARE